MDLGLKGRRALVLASSDGIGRGIAAELAGEGASVMICGRDEEKLRAASEQISRSAATKLLWVQVDLGTADGLDRLLQRVVDTWGAVDILINNTGGPPAKGLCDVSRDEWSLYFEAMLTPVFRLTAELVPAMMKMGWGRVISVASSGVIEPISGLGLSNALRSALVGWNKTLSNEVSGSGVTANLLVPGRINTKRVYELDTLAARRAGVAIDEVARQSESRIPVGRYGRVEEFAAVATFLASERASYITGSVIRVDGGMIRSV